MFHHGIMIVVSGKSTQAKANLMKKHSKFILASNSNIVSLKGKPAIFISLDCVLILC